MAIRYYLRDATGTVVEVAGRIRALTADTSVNAEEGSVGMFRVEIDDPAGTYRVGGHRLLYVVETAADPMDQIIAFGYTQERTISRGDLIEGIGTGGRVISVDVADLNTILSRRVMTGADARRPAETDVERVRWLVMTNEAALVIDSRFLDPSSPKRMEAVDYNGQMMLDVIQDCAEASGKNYGLTWFQTGADPHTQTAVSFFYLFPGDPIWSSTARLTNVAADVDDATTFVVASAELTQSPMRVYSGIYGGGDGVNAYRQSLATATAYARRDTIMSFPNVKSAAKLTSRIDRMLVSLATEEYRVALTFFMRPADVNRVRPGMRVQAKFSHLPELGTGYVWLRMLTRQVTQGEDETGFAFYKISGVFSATKACSVAAFDIITDTYSLTVTNTATGFYPALYANGLSGNDNAIGGVDGLVRYGAGGGLAARPIPNPLLVYDGGTWGGWSFSNYGATVAGMPTGKGDGGAAINNPKLQIFAVGAGQMTVWLASVATATWELYAVDTSLAPGAPGALSLVQSGSVSFPSTVIDIPDTSCLHYVLINDISANAGSLFYGGMDWVAST